MNATSKKWLRIAAIMGALAGILGAFGAHALEDLLKPDSLDAYNTGVDYQFYHTLGLLLVAIFIHLDDNKWLRRTAWCFFIGTIFFSGSIYLLTCRDILGTGALAPILGPITPIGGTFLIAGWGMLFLAGLTKK